MRIAHFSDTHVTRSPLEAPIQLLHGKRALGLVNWAIGRRTDFAGADARLGVLLEDVEARHVDHVLCTGDITSMSYEEEFLRAAEVFGSRRTDPSRYTVIPGNHDRYTRGAVEDRRFERYFGAVASPTGEYPAVKRIAPRVVLVLLDVSRPTWFGSSGLCGVRQLRALEAIVLDRSLASDFVILALHYGLLGRTGRPDRPSHRLVDYAPVLDVIEREDARVDLVVHGHLHRSFARKTRRGRALVCAGSATDLAVSCGYNVYDVDLETRRFTIERRTWSVADSSFTVPSEMSPISAARAPS